MTYSITIRPHGYPIQVESDHELTFFQRDLLEDTFEEIGFDGMRNSETVKFLSAGKEGEQPLKIIIADRKNWKCMSRFSFSFRWHPFFRTPQMEEGFKKGIGMYLNQSNEIILAPDFIPREENPYTRGHAVNIARGRLKHEIAHALNDFAVTRYYYSGFARFEYGSATTAYAQDPITMPLIWSDDFESFLREYYGNHPIHPLINTGERLEALDELVTSVMAYLSDPRRHILMARWLKNNRLNGVGYDGEGQFERMAPKEFEENDIFIQAIKKCIETYPVIPGENLEDQYDAGAWLPILGYPLNGRARGK